MIFTETLLKGAYIIDVKKIEDERGFFARTFCLETFEKMGLTGKMLQTNISTNKVKGTLRGLHMQEEPYAEDKLVRCTKGGIFDVLVDLRQDSETYKQWVGVELTEENFRMVYIPKGFAHGYLTLTDNTDVTYQVTQIYTPAAEKGFRWDDPAFAIEWPFTPQVISEKDQKQPLLKSVVSLI